MIAKILLMIALWLQPCDHQWVCVRMGHMSAPDWKDDHYWAYEERCQVCRTVRINENPRRAGE